MRTGRYRYVEWLTDFGAGPLRFRELYDHQTDPDESHNIAGNVEAGRIAVLSRKLAELRKND